MKVVIAGASGFIGGKLKQALQQRGDQVVTVGRRGADVTWDARSLPPGALDGASAVINLAGANLAAQRWNESFKKEILESRTLSTRAVVEAIRGAAQKPRVLVNASAVGFYGGRGDEVLDESAAPGTDFLAGVVKAWEGEAQQAPVRSVQIRTGVVLDPREGALAKMLPPFKAFVGGPIGNGKQWFPWIHIDDEVAAVLFCLDHEQLSGPVNLVAPGIATAGEFAKALGKALHRPSWAPVPAAALKLLLGEFSSALTDGQRAVPKKLLDAGFQFRHGALAPALGALFP